MGNKKTKPLELGMRVDSTADLQENSGDLITPNGADGGAQSGAHKETRDDNSGTTSAPAGRVGDCGPGKQTDSTLYKAVNLDENGKFIQFGFLEVTVAEIVFHRLPNEEPDALAMNMKAGKKHKDKQKAAAQQSVSACSDPTASRTALHRQLSRTDATVGSACSMPPIRWPFHLLRRYGYDQDLFTIETGRRACTGAGIYAFHTNSAADLFRDLQEAIKQSSANIRKKRETSNRTVRRLSSTEHAAEGKSAFNENSASDFMHWSPVLVAHEPPLLTHGQCTAESKRSCSMSAVGQPSSTTLKESSKSPPLPASMPATATATQASPHYMEPPKQVEHNYVNIVDKQLDLNVSSKSKPDVSSGADGDDAHEYKILCGEPRSAVQKSAVKAAAETHAEERQYENLSHIEEQRNADAYYVNITQMPRSAMQQRDANGHLPGCPCHRKSVNSKTKHKDSSASANSASNAPAARQLNYIELDLRNYLKQTNASANLDTSMRSECADTATTADSEDNATSLSEMTTQTKITAITNASSNAAQSAVSSNANGAGTGSSSPSGTSSSVFSANSKMAQASNSFLGLSESRQPLLGSGSIGSVSGVCATLALAKSGNQSRPNSDSLTQTHVCAVHKHVMKCKEHPLAKHCGSQRMIQYTQIDFERTTALTNSKKSLEGPRSSVSKELSSSKKNSADTLMGHNGASKKDRQGNDDQQIRQASTARASPPKAVANILVTDLLKRSRHNSNN